MHYNTIYLALFTAVAVSASILPRQCNFNDPAAECASVEACAGFGGHCDNNAHCCGGTCMFISVPSIHYYIDLPLPVCNNENICAINVLPSGF